MKIYRLELHHFRRFLHWQVDVSGASMVWVVGCSGSGKTTLLEAIHTLCTGRGWHSHSFQVRLGAPGFVLRMEAERTHPGQTESVELRYDQASRQFRLRWNGRLVPSLRQFLGKFPVWSFSAPRILQWIHGEPERRRAWMDLLLGMMYPEYLSLLQQYFRTLEQRNALLKKRPPDRDLLNVFTETLQQIGSRIQQFRTRGTQQLQTWCWRLLPSDLPAFQVEYVRSPLEQWQERIDRELEVGFSLLGIQREDWKFFLGGSDAAVPLREFLSSGEQYRLGVAWHLAGWLLLTEHFPQNPPVLLGDDLHTHQDAGGTRRILQMLNKAVSLAQERLKIPVERLQVWVTTFDPSPVEEVSLSTMPIFLDPQPIVRKGNE